MELGMIGLGRMGANMAQRLVRGGHRVVVYDLDQKAVAAAATFGCEPAASLSDLTAKLSPPRAVWLMLPSGEPTETTIMTLMSLVLPNDIVVDGGNSNYQDTKRRGYAFAQYGVLFVDAGASGGIWGLDNGYCLMLGGDPYAIRKLEPALKTLAPAPDRGWARVGPVGAGHFVKMLHNGIEYGLMQAYAEGFQLLQAKEEFHLDLAQVAELWRHGSVVRSWLLDLSAAALKEDPQLAGIAPFVEDSGEGRWTVQEAVDLGVPAPVITLALQARFRSRQPTPFAERLLAALRGRFGGHAIKPA